MTLNLGTGALGASPDPADWRSIPLDEAAVRDLMGTASLIVYPQAGFYATRPARDASGGVQYPTIADLATVTRASEARQSGWNFQSGAALGQGFVSSAGEARVGGPGMLIEPSATNRIRNPRGEGAGAPSVPTNWLVNNGGATVTFQGAGSAGGRNYTDWTLSGTPSAATIGIAFDSTSGIAASSGQAWTVSAGVQIVGGDLTGIDVVYFSAWERSSASGVLASNPGGGIAVDYVPRGFAHTVTLGNAATAFVQPYLTFLPSSPAVAINVTVRIYEPQIEQTAYPSSRVLPPVGSPGAASRAADVITIPVTDWLADEAVTVYARFSNMRRSVTNGRQNIWTLDGGGFTHMLNCYTLSSGSGRLRAQNSSGPDELGGLDWGAVPEAGAVTVVSAFADNDVYAASSLGAQVADTSFSAAMLSQVTTLRLGADSAGRQLNGYLEELRVWPYRLTDAQCDELAGLSAPDVGAPLLEMI